MNVIKLPHVKNFRGLGGYITQDGRKIKEGLLYRSAGFNRCTQEDIEILKELQIQYVVDFRESHEFINRPDILPEGVCHYTIPALVENEYTQSQTLNFFDLLQNWMTKEEIVASNAFLKEAYTIMPFDNEAFKQVFNLMKEHKYPIVFHCAGGKDRTGLMAALIMDILGVSWKDLMEHYMMSNQFIGGDGYVEGQLKLKNITDPELIDVVWKTVGVQEMYLEVAFDAILKKYPTKSDYYREEYGIDETVLKDLKDFYLE